MVTMGRKLIGFSLIIVIIIGGIFVWLNRDKYFMSEIVVTYPDGCIEKFIGTELVTSICDEGRRLEEEQSKSRSPFAFNIGDINWTSNKSED